MHGADQETQLLDSSQTRIGRELSLNLSIPLQPPAKRSRLGETVTQILSPRDYGSPASPGGMGYSQSFTDTVQPVPAQSAQSESDLLHDSANDAMENARGPVPDAAPETISAIAEAVIEPVHDTPCDAAPDTLHDNGPVDAHVTVDDAAHDNAHDAVIETVPDRDLRRPSEIPFPLGQGGHPEVLNIPSNSQVTVNIFYQTVVQQNAPTEPENASSRANRVVSRGGWTDELIDLLLLGESQFRNETSKWEKIRKRYPALSKFNGGQLKDKIVNLTKSVGERRGPVGTIEPRK